jgi:hypothetical protein
VDYDAAAGNGLGGVGIVGRPDLVVIDDDVTSPIPDSHPELVHAPPPPLICPWRGVDFGAHERDGSAMSTAEMHRVLGGLAERLGM